MSGPGLLLLINEDGTVFDVPNNFAGVKAALRDATIDGIRIDVETAAYINDNGIIEHELLNVPMSLWAGRPIYGPAVVMHAEPDDDGNEQPPNEDSRRFGARIAHQWRSVLANMEALGQPPFDVRGDDANLPPPQIIALTDEQFDEWLEGRR